MVGSEKWEEIQRLFEQAQALPTSQQKDFLEIACKSDKQLLEQISRMLSFDRIKTDPLIGIISNAATSISEESTLENTTIDKFKLLKRIGQGGMGDVYLASRIDKEYEQEVAIKIIRADIEKNRLGKLFQKERQILAHLNHPNICRLLDGGSTQEGKLYLVMEYIKGEPLDKYCKKNKLTLSEKLALFLQICDGVQAAHQNLIVHCDLKPSNILVTKQGTPILLDFGIANLLNSDLPEGQPENPPVALTYEYASPELLMGIPPTLSSDVFSLGVLLFEITTNSHPKHIKETTINLVKRFRRLETDTAPNVNIQESLANSGKKIQIKTLHWIFEHSTHFRQSERYQTVGSLSEDIQSYLRNRPISLHKNKLVYRLMCWIKRQTLLFASILIITSVITFWGIREIELRKKAENEVQISSQVTRFLVDLFREATPQLNGGKIPNAIGMLDNGVKILDVRLRNKIEIAIPLKKNIAISYGALGQLDKEAKLLKDILKLAITEDINDQKELADIYSLIGENTVNQGNIRQGITWFRKALSLLETMKGPIAEKVSILKKYASLLITLESYRDALRYLDEAIEICDEYPHLLLKEKLEILDRKALSLHKIGLHDDSITLYKQLLQLQEEHVGKFHPDYINVLEKLKLVSNITRQ